MEIKYDTEKIEDFIKTFNTYYEELDDLCKRLQEDYNCGEEFEQEEEDRLALCGILDSFDKLKED